MIEFLGRSILTATALAWAVVAHLGQPANARADQLPRYGFRAGLELVYHSTILPETTGRADSSASDGGGAAGVKTTLNVIAENADGSWQIILRQRDRRARGAPLSAALFSIRTDGTRVGESLPSSDLPALMFFPPLPWDQPTSQTSWSDKLPDGGGVRELHAESVVYRAEADWRFSERFTRREDEAYGIARNYEYVFDPKRGFIRQVKIATRQAWPKRAGNHHARIELVTVRQIPIAETGPLWTELRRYLVAQESYDARLSLARRDFSRTAALLDRAIADLKAATASLSHPDVRELADVAVANYPPLRAHLIERADRLGGLLGKPSPDWTTTDLEGKPHRLADYRGQVVLLDFWYRGCGYCIQAMPQIKQLVADFEGQPVAVIGINRDKHLPDAHFVIEAMELNYPTFKNETENGKLIEDAYRINSWPSLVLLDRQGVVRHIHLGNFPTLRANLGEEIRSLLAEQAATGGK
jgi:thiol-disulfide isomerase/thioredoxin